MKRRLDNDSLDNDIRAITGWAIFAVIGAVVLNLAFWLGLIGGALWLLKHFGAF